MKQKLILKTKTKETWECECGNRFTTNIDEYKTCDKCQNKEQSNHELYFQGLFANGLIFLGGLVISLGFILFFVNMLFGLLILVGIAMIINGKASNLISKEKVVI